MTFPFRLNDGRVIPLAGMEYLAPLLEYAAAAQANAEAAAALAVAAATSLPNVYSSTALGLAAVAEDGTFWVSSSDGLALYRDDGGSATLLYTMFEALAYKPTDPDLVGSIAIGNGLRNLFHTTADTGQANIAIGQDAGRDLGSGRLNILIGYTTGRNMTDLDVVNGYAGVNGNAGNVLIGGYSGSVANGAYDNTGVGTQCMLNLTDGMDNVAMGINALKNIQGGSENACFGHATLEYLVGDGDYAGGTGHRNTAIGDMAGRFLNDGTTQKTAGKDSTYVGTRTRSAGQADIINENVFGSYAKGEGSNTLVLGGDAITRAVIKGAVQTYLAVTNGSPLLDALKVSRAGAYDAYAYMGMEDGTDQAVFGSVYPGTKGQIRFDVSDGTTTLQAMRILANGKVGIGVGFSTPSQDLTVQGAEGMQVRDGGVANSRITLAADSANSRVKVQVGASSAADFLMASGATLAMRIEPTGQVNIGGGTGATEALEVTGNVEVSGWMKAAPKTVATLAAAATAGAGARDFVTDANATTFASVVAGGGANDVPVYSDGTDWRIG